MSAAVSLQTCATASRDGIPELEAVLADCLAITRELRLPHLLTMVMDQALAWTGAQLGCIALDHEDGLVVEVQGRVDRCPVSELQPVSLEDAGDVPRAIIRHVARTGNALDLCGEVDDGQFADDPYLRRARPRSLRCLPLLDAAGRVTAVVYLENCPAAGAGPDVLGLLAPHIAVAIDAARRAQCPERPADRHGRAPEGPLAAEEPARRGWDGAIVPSGPVSATHFFWASQLPDTALMRANVARAAAVADRARLQYLLIQSESTEAYFHGLLEAAPDATVMTTIEGRIARINRQTERLFGYRRDDLIGQPVEILMPERFRGAHAGHRSRYAAAPRFRPMGRGLQLMGRRSDGSEFPVEVSLSYFSAPDGFHILSSIRDVSERRAAEQALKESERFARATFDALPEHVCVLDERGAIVSTNAAWNTFAAANGADLARVGKGANYLDVCDAVTGPAAAAARAFADGIRAVMRGERECCTTEYGCHAPHEQRWFIARATRFPGEGPTRVVVAHENVTELKLAELELCTAKEAEEEARKQAEAAEQQIEERRQESERRRQVAENLRDVLATLNSSQPLDDVLHFIVSQSRRLLGGQAAALYRNGGGVGKLEVRVAEGLESEDVVAEAAVACGAVPSTPATSIAHADIRRVTVPGAHEKPVPEPYQSVLATPVVCNDGGFGTLAIYYVEPRTFAAEEAELASLFCDQVALAVENARLKDEAREAAALAERGRLARELHDSVTQSIFSASLIADSLPGVWERSPAEGRRGLEEVRRLTRGALAEMRTLLFELRPAALLEKKLGDLIGHFAVAVSSRTGVPIDVATDEEGSLPPDVHVALYRIVQEALNNITKHADASRASVRLRTCAGRAVVSVLDDGRGFDVSALPGGQFGLGNMQERARSIGARLRIVGRPGRGTIVAATWEARGRESSDG